EILARQVRPDFFEQLIIAWLERRQLADKNRISNPPISIQASQLVTLPGVAPHLARRRVGRYRWHVLTLRRETAKQVTKFLMGPGSASEIFCGPRRSGSRMQHSFFVHASFNR